MLRTVVRMVGLIATMVAPAALALGMGEIRVQSDLNQPFAANIPLLSAAPGELEGTRVSLASPEEYARAGIDRPDYLSTLRFTVVAGGSPHVVVSSEQPAREPMMTLLVEVRGASSRVLREYTVLLDPPGMSVARAAAASGTPSAARQSAATSTQPVNGVAAPRPASGERLDDLVRRGERAATDPSATPGRYGPVAEGETFWSIATRVRPSSRVTMDQVLLAIYAANPGAFERGSINGLLKGVTLTIPDEAAMRATGAAEARAQVAELQRGGRLAATSPAATPAPQTPPVTPAPAAEAPPVMPAASGAAEAETAAAESVVTAQPETTPETQAPSAEAPSAEAPSAEPAPGPEAASAADSAAPPGEAPAITPDAAAAAAAAPATEETPPATDPPATPATAPAPGGAATAPAEPAAEASRPWRLPLLVALGLIVLLLLMLRLRRARRGSPAAPQQWVGADDLPPVSPVSLAGSTSAVAAAAAATAATAAAQEALPASSGAEPERKPELAPSPPPSTEPTAPSQPVSFDESLGLAGGAPAAPEVADALSEADFHIAYGLYEEAATLLEDAIRLEPHRPELRVKLAETYFAAGRPIEFFATAKALEAELPPNEWQKIVAMGEQLSPGGLAPAPPAQALGLEDFAMDTHELSTDSSQPAPAPIEEPRAVVDAGQSLDFDLSDFDLAVPSENLGTAGRERAVDPNSIDFDLAPFDDPAPATPASAAANPDPMHDRNDSQVERMTGFHPDASPAAIADPFRELPRGAQMRELSDSFGTGLTDPLAAPTPDDAGPGFRGLPLPEEVNAEMVPEDFDLGDLQAEDPISDGDETATKLDLARAYVDMGDTEMARSLLEEVQQEGSLQQQTEAQGLLGRLF